ncbi:MAG: DUF4349 domain-containing protein, partial [Oscillospiraceae bacterium]|nr:DUF4349 domain-containing protein [Oscillospiraceae bacterium]
MKNFSKLKFIIPAVLSAALFAGCGESDREYFSYESNGSDGQYIAQSFSKGSSGAYDSDGYYSEEAETRDYASKNNEESSSLAADSIQKEMLVYSCHMEVDTLDFDASLNSFKNTLDTYGGFVEIENFNDGGGGGRWYYENEEKWQSY